MRDHIWRSRFLVTSAALLFLASFEAPTRTLCGTNRQAAELPDIRWEFDTGG